MLKEIDLGKKSKGPYAIYYVYPKNDEPCVVKGDYTSVDEYVHTHLHPAVYRYTFWRGKESRGSWWSTNKDITFKKRGKYFIITVFSRSRVSSIQFRVRRIPHKWIPEYDASC